VTRGMHRTLRVAWVVMVWAALGMGCVSHRLNQSLQPVEWGDVMQSSPRVQPCLVVCPQEKVPEHLRDMNPVARLPFFAMAAVESRHDPFAVGDRGRAIGLYQIHREYWKDSGVPGKWENCRDPHYSQRVILAYWKRYCPDALKRGDLEVLCRVHNGGPQGYLKRNTMVYWRKIQAVSTTSVLCPVNLGDLIR